VDAKERRALRREAWNGIYNYVARSCLTANEGLLGTHPSAKRVFYAVQARALQGISRARAADLRRAKGRRA
jgi:hypothetical protein